jgi:hypothetical protein
MKAHAIKSILPAVFAAAIATTFIQACSVEQRVSAQSAEAVDPIEGLWSSQVIITDCHGTATRTFSALNLFGRGGTVVDADSQPPTSHGPGLGVWASAGKSHDSPPAPQYSSSFKLFRFNTDGSFAGYQQIARTITLAKDGQSFTSTITASALDTNGNPVGNAACGTEAATKQFTS